MRKVLYTIGLLSSVAFVSGWMMDILHLPGAREFSIFGFLAFVVIFLPVLSIDHHRSKAQRTRMQKAKFFLGLSSALIVALSVIFKLVELEGAPELLVIGTVIFCLCFLPIQFLTMYRLANA
jgi:hypothetical protein